MEQTKRNPNYKPNKGRIHTPITGEIDDTIKKTIVALSKKNGKRYRRRTVRSLVVLSSTVRDGSLFSGNEPSTVSMFADYAKSCLISTPTGILCTLKAKIYAPSMEEPVLVNGTTPFKVHSEIQRLHNSIQFEYRKDNKKRREFRLSEVADNLPVIVQGAAIGTPADTYRPVSAILPESEDKRLIILSELAKTSTMEVVFKLPTGAPAISTDLDNYLLAVDAEIAEEDN